MIRKFVARYLSSPNDKRQHQRVEASYVIRIIGESGNVMETIPHVRELSEGGMRFRTKNHVQKESHIKMVIKPPGPGKEIAVQTRVVWIHPSTRSSGYIVGVSFIHILERDRAVFRKFVNHYRE